LLLLVIAIPDVYPRRRRIEVVSCRSKNFGLIPCGRQKPRIAHVAEKTADKIRLVIVIDGEPVSPLTAADGACAALGGQ
jgi:hypothetical protein